MKRPVVLIIFCVLVGFLFFGSLKKYPPYVELGDASSQHVWIYLCGLSQNIYAERHGTHKTLDAIGQRLHIQFLAITPQHRCPDLRNMLCWPQDTAEQIRATYQEIMDAVGDKEIQGFIGFSNGGFFLNQLAQFVPLNKPIISVGSAGPFYDGSNIKNKLYLVIGKQDSYHYDYAVEFYNRSKNSPLDVTLLEYAGGHVVPLEPLEELLQKINA